MKNCIFFLLLLLLAGCQQTTVQDENATVSTDDPWANVGDILANIQPPAFPDKTFDITEYGAKADGKSDCIPAIQAAIAACEEAGGGKVLVPAGDYFAGGPIHLKSNVNLHIAAGATVKFSTDPQDYLPVVFTRWEGAECYNYSPLIYAFEQENIAVTGKGTLDGQADNENWWPWCGSKHYGWQDGTPSQADDHSRPKLFDWNTREVPVEERVLGKGSYLRPNFLQPYRCKNVLIDGVTIRNSPIA